MNYRNFMKQVNDELIRMSEEDKNDFIREAARKIHEKQRQVFLDSLTNTISQTKYQIHSIMDEIKAWSEKVENKDIYIECTGYEAYGEGHYGEWVNEYTDVFGIGKELTKMIQIAEDLLYQKQYIESQELYEYLLSMEYGVIDVHGGDDFELELEDLVDENLIDLDVKESVLHLMYASYQTFREEERTNTLYRYFLSWKTTESIKVEDIFSVGPEELDGISIFMEEWISFLKNKDGDLAARLLTEASIYQGGVDRLVNEAKSVPEKHPILYKNACKNLLREARFSECEKVGLEAIRLLPKKLVVRGQIADLTAKAAIQLENNETRRECYEAAFYADSTLSHYLRLLELPAYEKIMKQAAMFMDTLPEDTGSSYFKHKNEQLRINTTSKELKKGIHFFNQEFDEIINACKKDKTELGWSSHFKGFIVPLFILALNTNKQMTAAGKRMLDNIAARLGYKDEEKGFAERFLVWKRKIVITNEQYDKYVAWLQKEIDKRTEAVVGGGHRHSYYKPAELIAAFGEALESNGEVNGKEKLIEHYKKVHSRKSAFKAELNSLR